MTFAVGNSTISLFPWILVLSLIKMHYSSKTSVVWFQVYLRYETQQETLNIMQFNRLQPQHYHAVKSAPLCHNSNMFQIGQSTFWNPDFSHAETNTAWCADVTLTVVIDRFNYIYTVFCLDMLSVFNSMS